MCIIQPVTRIRMELWLFCVWAAQNPLRSVSSRRGLCNLYLQTLMPHCLRDPMETVSSGTSGLPCISEMASEKALRRKSKRLKFLLEVGCGQNAWTHPLGLHEGKREGTWSTASLRWLLQALLSSCPHDVPSVTDPSRQWLETISKK